MKSANLVFMLILIIAIFAEQAKPSPLLLQDVGHGGHGEDIGRSHSDGNHTNSPTGIRARRAIFR